MALAIAQRQAEKAKPEDIDRILAELEAISDEQARQFLAHGKSGQNDESS
jgi:hypothetical protein